MKLKGGSFQLFSSPSLRLVYDFVTIETLPSRFRNNDLVEHQSAVDRQLSERYLLGDLSVAEAAAFEAHFFECPLCAEEVRLGAQLAANLRTLLIEQMEVVGKYGVLTLTIPLAPAERVAKIECEFRFAGAPDPVALAPAVVEGNQVCVRLPATHVFPGACTLTLREAESRRPLGHRRFEIPNFPD